MQCLKCSKEFKTKQELTRHLNRKIKCDNKIECKNCKKEFKTKQKLEYHKNNKKGCKTKELETENMLLKKDNEILELKNKILEMQIKNGTIVNNTINNNNITNININFGDEDVSHITKRILEREILKIINNEIEIDDNRLNKYKELGAGKVIRTDLLNIYSKLTRLIYFNNKPYTMKKEEDKYYIKDEEWQEIELEKLNKKVIEKQQNTLVKINDSTYLKDDDKRFKKVIEDYFVTDDDDEIKNKNIEKLNLFSNKRKIDTLNKLLNYELELS
jgi:hypothetical protein